MTNNKFKCGDIVLCHKYSVSFAFVMTENCMRTEPIIEDCFFNRKAIVSKVYKEYMDKTLGENHEDKNEYEITFLDDFTTLSWVSGKDLIFVGRY